ncbi:MAG: hypothetical protein AAF927_32630 [Bacteroidota bacterium]
MWDNLLALLSTNEFWQYASIPFVSAIVGWGTNVIALKMTFYPIKFFGIWKIGWQGIIPSRAGFMAAKAVDLLTKNLISIEERFTQIEPERVAEEMEPVLQRLSEQIVRDTMEEKAPMIWEAAPEMIKTRIFQKVSTELPEVVEELMEDVKTNITDLFDLKGMVVEELEANPELLNLIFTESGKEEFKFIERSGFYFGFLFGLFQMLLWVFWQEVWILPAAGLVVGWATNFLALKLIFEPLNPKKFGPWRFQGLFIARQVEVAAAYAKVVASQILTSENIFIRLLHGPAHERLEKIVHLHVKKAVDSSAGISKPLFQLTQGTKRYLQIKQTVAQRFVEELPHSIHHLFGYAEEALDIENTLRTRMQALAPENFVGFLRPIFQEDEWKLILVGAVLGALAGLAQLIFIFGGLII